MYLTPHYGHEMILREPDNGRLLPWEPDGMAAVIGDDMREGRFGNFHTELGEPASDTALWLAEMMTARGGCRDGRLDPPIAELVLDRGAADAASTVTL